MCELLTETSIRLSRNSFMITNNISGTQWLRGKFPSGLNRWLHGSPKTSRINIVTDHSKKTLEIQSIRRRVWIDLELVANFVVDKPKSFSCLRCLHISFYIWSDFIHLIYYFRWLTSDQEKYWIYKILILSSSHTRATQAASRNKKIHIQGDQIIHGVPQHFVSSECAASKKKNSSHSSRRKAAIECVGRAAVTQIWFIMLFFVLGNRTSDDNLISEIIWRVCAHQTT